MYSHFYKDSKNVIFLKRGLLYGIILANWILMASLNNLFHVVLLRYTY